MPSDDLGAGGGGPGTLRRVGHVVALGVRAEPRLFAIAVAGSVLYGVLTAGMAQAVGGVTATQITPAIAAGELDRGRVQAVVD